MDYRYDHILIRYGELSLKGKNRNSFIKQLMVNVKKAEELFADLIQRNDYSPASLSGLLHC